MQAQSNGVLDGEVQFSIPPEAREPVVAMLRESVRAAEEGAAGEPADDWTPWTEMWRRYADLAEAQHVLSGKPDDLAEYLREELDNGLDWDEPAAALHKARFLVDVLAELSSVNA